MSACCQHKTKHRSPEEQKSLTNRLSRIEGQVRGLREMLQKDAYCTDILVQVSAVTAALNELIDEGTYQEVLERWDLGEEALEQTHTESLESYGEN